MVFLTHPVSQVHYLNFPKLLFLTFSLLVLHLLSQPELMVLRAPVQLPTQDCASIPS